MVSYLQFKDLTASPVLIRLYELDTQQSLHTCSIPNPSLSPASFTSFLPKDSKNPVPFPESMLFLCNPGTRVRTTRPDPAWSLSGSQGQNALQTTQPGPPCIPHRLRSQAVLLGGPALRPGHPSATALIHRSMSPPRGRRAARCTKRLARLSKGRGLLPSCETLAFLGFHQFSKLCPALLHLRQRWDTTLNH